ncbi:MAG: AAA family ATPase [Archaeoglobaceae archaeon]
MLLKKLEIKNWCNHRQKTIEFKPGLNIIIGPNGSGKTNLIEAILYALSAQTSKSLRLIELCYAQSIQNPFRINLLLSNNIAIRRKHDSKEDTVTLYTETREEKRLAIGREKVNAWIEKNIIKRDILFTLAYNNQLNILDLIEMTPTEKEVFLNKIFRSDILLDLDTDLKELLREIEIKIADKTLMYNQLASHSEKETSLIQKQISELYQLLETTEQKIALLTKQKQALQNTLNYYIKQKYIANYLHLKRDVLKYKQLHQEAQTLKQKWLENKQLLLDIQANLQNIDKKIKRIQELKKLGKCLYCERELSKTDYETYNRELNSLEKQKATLIAKEKEFLMLNEQIKEKIEKIEKLLKEKDIIQMQAKLKLIRQKCLELPSFKEIRQQEILSYTFETCQKLLDEVEAELNEAIQEKTSILSQIQVLEKSKQQKNASILLSQLEKQILELTKLKSELSKIRQLYKDGIFSKAIKSEVKKYMPFTELFSLFNLGTAYLNDDFDIILNGFHIKTASMGQKIITNILLKILFLQFYNIKFLILDEPTSFLDKERRHLLINFFNTLKQLNIIPQLIIVTHDEILTQTNYDNLIVLEGTNA